MENILPVSAAILVSFAMGFLFHRGKGKWLIAGYNTMTEAERRKYDEKKLMKIMSHGTFTIAGGLTLVLAGELSDRRAMLYAGFGLMTAAIIAILVLLNTRARRKE